MSINKVLDDAYKIIRKQQIKMRMDENTKVNKINNHINGPTYICKVYLCGQKSIESTCYCNMHTSPLRTGKPLFTRGSAPIIKRWFLILEMIS